MTYINVLYTENSITLCYIYVQKKQVLMPYFVRLANNFYAWNHEFILKQILVIISLSALSLMLLSNLLQTNASRYRASILYKEIKHFSTCFCIAWLTSVYIDKGKKLYCTVHIYLFCVVATNCPLYPMVTAAPSVGLIKHTHNSWSHTIFLKT